MNRKNKILIINGPNLNLLGIREPNKYGTKKLENIISELKKKQKKLKCTLLHYQNNAEHKIINQIHRMYKKTDFIIINPASLSHTSIGIRDALLAVNIPFIEVHLSNIFSRERFRHKSYLSDISIGMICGLGEYGYYLAIKAAIKFLNKNNINK